jgi:hypothetical protein
MPKMSHVRKDHRQPQAIGGGNYRLIADRSAWLNNGGCTSRGRYLNAVREGEKGIRCHHRTPDALSRL